MLTQHAYLAEHLRTAPQLPKGWVYIDGCPKRKALLAQDIHTPSLKRWVGIHDKRFSNSVQFRAYRAHPVAA